jgi:hypothetical protein
VNIEQRPLIDSQENKKEQRVIDSGKLSFFQYHIKENFYGPQKGIFCEVVNKDIPGINIAVDFKWLFLETPHGSIIQAHVSIIPAGTGLGRR